MTATRAAFSLILALFVLAAARTATADPLQQVTVTGLQLVSSQRVDRVRFDYTYRVIARNDSGRWLGDVTGEASSASAATELRDARVTFGDIAAGQTATSTDTITLRQDRREPFGGLSWAMAGFAPTRIAIEPAASLLEPGQSRSLTAVLVDVWGRRLSGRAVSWSTLTPDIVGVSSAGAVTAGNALGIGRVQAQFAGLVSRPGLVTVADVAPGVRLIEDADILEGPTSADSAQLPSLSNAFQVVVRGGLNFEPGQKIANTGMAPVAGRVESVVAEGGNQRLRILVIPLPEILERYLVRESFDLSEDLEIASEVLTDYDYAVDGNTFIFTRRSTGPAIVSVGFRGPVSDPMAATDISAIDAVPDPGSFDAITTSDAAVGTSALEPICEFKNEGKELGGVDLPITISGSPTVKISIDGQFDVEADEQNGLTRYALQSKASVELEDEIKVAVAFAGKVTCDFVWLEKLIPFPGVLALFLGTELQFGPGLELAGSLSTTSLTAGFAATVTGKLDFDFTCTPSGCDSTLQTSLPESGRKFKPEFSAALFEPIVKAELAAYAFARARVGLMFNEEGRVELLTGKLGFGLEGEFAVPAVQVASREFASKYKLNGKASLNPGDDIRKFLDIIGLGAVPLPKLEITTKEPFAESPKGTLRLDRPSYLPGETVNVTVVLDPDTLDFLSLVEYNVERIEIVRRTGPLSTELLLTLTPPSGENEIAGSFEAPALLSENDIHALIVSRMLPFSLFGLEVDKASGLSVAGGVFDTVLRAEPGTSLFVKLRKPDGSLVPTPTPVTITGPAGSGWNNGQPLVVDYPANARRQYYLQETRPVRAGTYTATAVVDGETLTTTFDVDVANRLARASNVDAEQTSTTTASATWDLIEGAESHDVGIFDRTNNVFLQPRKWVTVPLATIEGLSPEMVPGGDYSFQILAFNVDFTRDDPPLPKQFNASFDRALIGARVIVSPSNATVLYGGLQSYSARVEGLLNQDVIWSATGGVIDADGTFQAGSTSGNYTVTATSVVRPDVKGSATVEVRNPDACTPQKVQETLDGSYRISNYFIAVSNNSCGFSGNEPVGVVAKFLTDPEGRVRLSNGQVTFSGGTGGIVPTLTGTYQCGTVERPLFQFGVGPRSSSCTSNTCYYTSGAVIRLPSVSLSSLQLSTGFEQALCRIDAVLQKVGD